MTLSVAAACWLCALVGAMVGAGILAAWWHHDTESTYFSIDCPHCDVTKRIPKSNGFDVAMEKTMLFTLRHANCKSKKEE